MASTTPDWATEEDAAAPPPDWANEAPDWANEEATARPSQTELLAQKEALAAQPPANVWSASFPNVARMATSAFGQGAAAVAKGAAYVSEAEREMRLAESPHYIMPSAAEERKVVRGNPLFQAGDVAQKFFDEMLAPIPEDQLHSVAGQLAQTVGGLGLVATGAGAPVAFGLAAIGDQFDRAYEESLASGQTPDQAAETAANRALLSGGKEVAVWGLGPKVFRAAIGEKMAKVAGETVAKSWLGKRIAPAVVAGTEVGMLSAASKAGENVIEGNPVLEGTGTAAVGGFGLGGALGALHTPKPDETVPRMARPADDNLPPPEAITPEPPPSPEGPPPPETAPIKPVAQERLSKDRENAYRGRLQRIDNIGELRKLENDWLESVDDPRQQHVLELLEERKAEISKERKNADALQSFFDESTPEMQRKIDAHIAKLQSNRKLSPEEEKFDRFLDDEIERRLNKAAPEPPPTPEGKPPPNPQNAPPETDAQRFAREQREASAGLAKLKADEAAAETERSKALDELRPAIQTESGDVIEGTTDQSHNELLDQQGDNKALLTVTGTKGFTRGDGKFITREEAKTLLGESEPLQTERLKEIRAARKPKEVTTNAAKKEEGQGQQELLSAPASTKPVQQVKVEPRHLEIARDELNVENPPDIFDLIDEVTTGPVKFAGADFAEQHAAAKELSKSRQGRNLQERSLARRRVSETTGMAADKVIQAIAAKYPKFAGYKAGDLFNQIIDDAHIRLNRNDPNREEVRTRAKQIAQQEAAGNGVPALPAPDYNVPDSGDWTVNEPKGAYQKTLDLLDKGIAATQTDIKDLLGGTNEIWTGLPVWGTKAVLNTALKLMREAFVRTRDLAQAVAAGLEYLRGLKLTGYNEEEARKFLEENVKERKFNAQLEAAQSQGMIGEGTFSNVENRLYFQRPQEPIIQAQSRAIELVGGPREAVRRWDELTNGVKPDEQVALGALIIRQLGVMERAAKAGGDEQLAQDIALQGAQFIDEQFTRYATELGQGVSMFKSFLAMSPQMKFIWGRNRIERARQAVTNLVAPDVKASADQMATINAQGIDTTTAAPDVQQSAKAATAAAIQQQAETPGSPIRQAIQLEASNSLKMLPSVIAKARAAVVAGLQKLGGKEYAEGMVKSSANALNSQIERAMTPEERKGTTTANIFADLTRSLRDQIAETLKATPSDPATGQSKMQRLRQLFGNAEQMSRVWTRVRTEMQGKLAALDALERRLAAIPKAIEELQSAKISDLDVAVKSGAITTPEQTTPAITRAVRQQALDNRNANIDREIADLQREFAQAKVDIKDMVRRAPGWKAILRLSPVEVFGAGILRDVIREELASQGQSLIRMVTDHFAGKTTDPALRAVPLAEQIAAQAGIDRQQAKSLVDAIAHEWQMQVAKAKDQLRERLELAKQRERDRQQRIRQSRPIAEREAEAAAAKLAGSLDNPAAAPQPAIAEFYQRLTANLRRMLPANSPKNGLTDMQLVREAFLNSDKYEQVWQQLRAEITARYGIEGMADVTGTLGKVTPEALAETQLDNLIRQKLTETKLNMSRIIRQHHTQQDATGRTLADKLAAEAGVPPDMAAKLAEAVRRRFAATVTRAKEAALKRLLRPIVQRSLNKPGLAQKIIEATNAGQLSAEQYWNVVKERLKLPEWSKTVSDDLQKRVDEIEQIPDSQTDRKNAAMQGMMTALDKAAGNSLLDLGQAFFITNLMFGINTHAANVIGNTTSALSAIAAEGAQLLMEGRPLDALTAMEAMYRGRKQTVGNIAGVLATGQTPALRSMKAEPGHVLETAQFGQKGGVPLRGDTRAQEVAKALLETRLASVLNLWKANGRALAAEDLLFFTPAYQAKLAILTTRLYRQEGMSGKNARQKASEVLGFGQPATEAAQQQAEREGYEGHAKWRRVAEILESRVPENLRQTAREYALRVTLNNQPYGLLGAVAKLIQSAKNNPDSAALRAAATAIAPIINIPANWFNESLNYSPIGFARILGKKLYGKAAKDLTPEQWRDLKAEVASKATMGTLLLASLALKYWPNKDDQDKAPVAIYGSGPMNPADREGWKERGNIPYSVRVGNHSFSYALTPYAVPLSIMANMMDRSRDANMYGVPSAGRAMDNLASVAGYSLTQSGATMLDQSFMLGISDLMETLREPNPERASVKLAKTLARAGTSVVIPQEIRNIDKRLDPRVYRPQDTAAALVQAVPFVRREGNVALNALGNEITWPPDKRFTSELSDNKAVNLLADLGAWPAVPDRHQKYTLKAGRELSDEEYAEYVKKSGANAERILTKMADAPDKLIGVYAGLHPEIPLKFLVELSAQPDLEERKRMIQRAAIADIITQSRKAARQEMGLEQ